jgi:SAM-dependent methyltransferase
VTAVDFSPTAVERGSRLAERYGVRIDFVVANAAAYEPDGEFDLVTSFYIQLPPHQRAAMLAMAATALAPGGTLLFASHDRSGPPEGWTDEDVTTLTTPEQVTAELPGLRVEKAVVVDGTESHGRHAAGDSGKPHRFRNTVVRAVRP